MNYIRVILEAILVGFYEVILYFIFSIFINNLYLLLLVVGFFKHFFGYYLGFHKWYCNNGVACINANIIKNNYESISNNLIKNSFEESIIQLILGIFLSIFLTDLYLFFTIGFILHIIAEYLGIHKQFCRKNCQKDTNY